MPLTRLELQDFKSYRGHQVIAPLSSFTSIIGPNGSGKSNLMDAISFVLGVKSAQLRSRQLKDLIYRGRKLQVEAQDTTVDAEEPEEGEEEGGEGSADRAWVMAVYLDDNGKEFRYQRTVSLSGSSTYAINGKIVTYTTYNQSLEKQNILVKAKNFLVFQGDVEAIARQSPKELCRLVEQISGSLDLAQEYEALQARLEKATAASTENFHNKREITKEFKAWREFKTEVGKKSKLERERDNLKIQHVLWRLFHIEKSLDETKEEMEIKDTEIKKVRKEVSLLETNVREARKDQGVAHQEIAKQEKVIKKKEKALEAERPKLAAIETQASHSLRKAENAESQAKRVVNDVKRQEDTLKSLKSDLAVVEKASKQAQDAARKASQKQGRAMSEDDLGEYRKLKSTAHGQNAEERQQLDGLRRQHKKLRGEKDEGEERLRGLQLESQKLKDEIRELERRREGVEIKMSTLKQSSNMSKQELKKIQAERTRIHQLETETNEKLMICYNKLQQAKADRNETEKETKMKETVAQLKRLFPGVHGRVIDLCKPTQNKYQTAVSIILGRNIDSVVIDHEKTAIECISFLRSQQLGQLTFIPLDSIQIKPTNDKYRSFAKGARLAIDVIEFSPAHQGAMQFACGNSLVCDTMDVARFVCYEKSQDVKAVTLEGTVIHKSGSITGGQSSAGTGRKWDDNEVAGLTKNRDALLSHMEDLRKQKLKLKPEDALMAEINRTDADMQIVRDDLDGTNLRLNDLHKELKSIEKDVKSTTAEIAKQTESLKKVDADVARLEKTVFSAEDKTFASFCKRIKIANIREYESEQLDVVQAEEEAKVKFELQITRLNHQISFENEQLKTTKKRLEQLQNSSKEERSTLKEHQLAKEKLETSIAVAEEEINSLRENMKEATLELEKTTEALEEAKRAVSKSSKVLDKISKDIGASNDVIEKLSTERTVVYRRCKFEGVELPLAAGSLNSVPIDADEADVDVAPMDVDNDDENTQTPAKTRDFGIEVDFSELDEDDKENGSEDFGEEMENSIAKIEAEILKLEPNMKAAERMSGVQEKLVQTEKDVEKARKETNTAKEEFNTVKKKRCDLFNKAFTHISERIDQVYKDLTKGKAAPMGGVAYLSLEDSEEPYLAGLKYHAMPPMKRFRDMDQLSGGEQTVAALALLLAIHSYQPAPFFVLDEVDAALDPTNVARVGNYLRQHSSSSFQFIVISLKDTLYERSNSLVGIYRDQDVNSSRSMTLDLTTYDEDA